MGRFFFFTRPVLVCLVVCQVGSFSDTPRDGFCLVIRLVGSFFYTPRAVGWFVGVGVSRKRPVLESVSSVGTWGVFLTRPVLA